MMLQRTGIAPDAFNHDSCQSLSWRLHGAAAGADHGLASLVLPHIVHRRLPIRGRPAAAATWLEVQRGLARNCRSRHRISLCVCPG